MTTAAAWQQRKSGVVIPRPPEFKAVGFRVKAVNDKQYQIEGILNAIGNIDDGHDRTLPNAFKKTINDSYSRKSAQHLDFLWPYLWSHSAEEPPIGGIFDADEVKARGDDPAGLYIKTQLIPDIARARDVYACFKSQQEGNVGSSGLLRQSMGYKPIRYEWVNEEVDGQKTAVRNLLEVQVWEGSACVFPMNELSVVTNVKSQPSSRSFYMGGIETKETGSDANEAPQENNVTVTTIPNTEKPQRKDFNQLYQAAQAADCLEDWGDIINAFTQAMIQTFGIGGSPQSDMQACLDQLGIAVMAWVTDAQACDLAQYISDRGYCGDSTPYVPYSMRVGESGYGYMSRGDKPASKAGRRISSETQRTLEQHQEEMKTSLGTIGDHVKAMEEKVSGLTQLWHEEGLGEPYTNDKSNDGNVSTARREPLTALTREEQPPPSTAQLTIDDLAAILAV